MKRDLHESLEKWSESRIRIPLIIRGARQVGKTWLIKEFSKKFDSFININFEKNKTIAAVFQGDIDIPQLLGKIALYYGKQIVPGNTLLFLDEIQECEEAIASLRYFKEEYPELHVIAAGSLLDFKIEKVGLPVGRIDFLYLTPLSFGEFLDAYGRNDLRQYILQKGSDPTISQVIQELLKIYIWLGGMPDAVKAWIDTQDVGECQQIQDRIILAYKMDFEKYAKRNLIPHVEKVFFNIPHQLGKKFKYVSVDNTISSYTLKDALLLLEQAGIATLCYHTNVQQPPLAAGKDMKRYKVFFFDIGLSQRILGLTHKDWIINSIKVENLGAIAEQLVAQELVAYQSTQSKAELFYWHREAKSSNAEVDFLTTKNSNLIPIEVKSGKSGSLKSMHLYLDTHPNAPYGLKISEAGFSKHGRIIEIPLHAIESWVLSDS